MAVWIRTQASWLVRCSLVGAVVLSSVLVPVVGAQAAAASPHALTGLLKPVKTIDPIHPPATLGASPATPSKTTRSKGVRSIHALHAASTLNGGAGASSDSTPVDDGNGGHLQHNFNGVSSLDSAVTNFGAEFQPPDQGLCVGNGFVIDAVNSAYTFYRTNGSVIAGPFNVNQLFGDGFAQFTSDPRCYYDRATNRWFAIILFIADDNASARTEIAVSSSGDPTDPWTIYHLDGTDDGTNGTPTHPGCPCFGDQPLLGLDQHNLYVSANEFSILGPQFNGTQLYAVAKSELVAAASAHFVMFENLTIGGGLATTVQPATSPQDAPAEYFMNSLDPTGTTDNRIGVWALTDRQAVVHGGVPNLSSVILTSETYGVPPQAVQRGLAQPLDSGDDRMQQVEYINGELWGELDTVVNPAHDTSPRAGAAWFRVRPSLDDQHISSAHMVHQGYLASKGNYLLYPAVQVSPEGAIAMVFTLSGPTIYGSAAYAVMSNDHAFGKIKVAGAGTAAYVHGTQNRWGDYSYAAIDPNGSALWFATEYIPPAASQTHDGFNNWGTRVFEVNINDN
jgi:hypothetical protein